MILQVLAAQRSGLVDVYQYPSWPGAVKYEAVANVAFLNTMSVKPLVYSCSGCSDVAQVTNGVALALDRRGLAEMSCIAGVGGKVPGLVRVARSGRPIIALDGCPMACVKSCLQQLNLEPTHYFRFDEIGLKKSKGVDFVPEHLEQALKWVIAELPAE